DLNRVLEALERAEVPSGRVFDPEDIVNDAHYAASNMIERWQLPDGKSVKIPAVVPKLSATPGATRWLGPKLGEHNAQVLASLGYSPEQQQNLKQRGII
ncbi:MAG: CoA transferase, partial [Burkholderiales bacterium]